MKNIKIYLFSLAIAVLAMASCSDSKKEHEQEVTDFAGKIVKYAQENTVDSIIPLYPGLEDQKVTLASVGDSVKLETLDNAIYLRRLVFVFFLFLRRCVCQTK